ncbi:MBL fold metallo-hydrolase [Vibrio sp. MA40-2]|uniref:MBL fold metallo-hydrolase n=1 Tax=Vibrio sp. MA40-2 TaxID=3391828 RepID=UPI0039A60772
MKIEVIGCGSAFSKVNNTSSLLVEDNSGKQWLIDCGPTVPRALFNRDMAVNDIQVIYFTHIHPDHCTGLSALVNYWKSFNRTEPVTIFCQPEQLAPLKFLAEFANWPSNDLCFDIDWQMISDHFSWQEWQIATANTQHEVSNKAIQISVDGHRLFYSGDGRPTAASINLMKHADLSFQECASFISLDDSSSHGDFSSCLALLEQTATRYLGLYHCWDESLSEIIKSTTGIESLFVSRDGLFIDLSDIARCLKPSSTGENPAVTA